MLDLEQLFDRIRLLLRHGEAGDSWPGSSPSRDEIEAMLGGDDELIAVVFEEPVAATLERYVSDPRLKDALAGQGVIGTWAGPRDPGTAAVRLMHAQGDLLGPRAPCGATSTAAWAGSRSRSPTRRRRRAP